MTKVETFIQKGSESIMVSRRYVHIEPLDYIVHCVSTSVVSIQMNSLSQMTTPDRYAAYARGSAEGRASHLGFNTGF